MKSAVMFSRVSDDWQTPRWLFDQLDAEFDFAMDAAATAETALCSNYRGPDHPRPDRRNALVFDWASPAFLNPPYSQVRDFIAKAAEEAAEKACTVVALVPARTDTWWWHLYVWDGVHHRPRPGVEVRFLRGRLKFSGSKNSAPFPSAVVVFRPPVESVDGGWRMR